MSNAQIRSNSSNPDLQITNPQFFCDNMESNYYVYQLWYDVIWFWIGLVNDEAHD